METLIYHRRKVYDPILRIIHAWNGLSILILMATVWLSDLFPKGAQEDALWQAHIMVGYALVCGLVARLAWGLVGPAHARFTDLWHPAAWWQAVRHLDLQKSPRFGHDRLASGVYLLVYLLLLVMAVTGLGLAAAEHGTGPFNAWCGDMPGLKEVFEAPHEAIYNLLIAFVIVHIGALIWHERKDKTPLAQAMVSGYQYQLEETKGATHE
ncbi:MAG: cytochrome b/b6 domain-containing protein [Methylophilaceae bacterium]|nr:cytochrome b/b6 domain-containing protein [Methylophilaceae bacterium]